MKTGILVVCTVCGYTKKPIGRSAPMESLYCTDDCTGYRQAPHAGDLWPDETEEDFGYAIGPHGVVNVVDGSTKP